MHPWCLELGADYLLPAPHPNQLLEAIATPPIPTSSPEPFNSEPKPTGQQ